MIPMFPESLQLGLCEEAFGNEDASQILSAASTLREKIWSADCWGRSNTGAYPDANMYFLANYLSTPRSSQKVFSFYDFHLLRTKKSLAGATHIKPEYLAVNYVWNGPTLNQDKKMVSKIVTENNPDLSEPIKKIEQFWGWDTEFNCYPKKTKGMLSVGCIYLNANNSTNFSGAYSSDINLVNTARSAARLIGQKAKTYLQGDSIYDGKALGFGGRIFNSFGESLIAVRLDNGDWIGSLNNFEGGKGYWFVLNDDLDYHYNLSDDVQRNFVDKAVKPIMHNQSSIQSFYIINNVTKLL